MLCIEKMAARRTEAQLEQEIRAQQRIYQNAEPGSQESEEARHRVRQLLVVLQEEYEENAAIELMVVWEDIQRQKRLEEARKKRKRDRCSVMARGGTTRRNRIGSMK
jgi:hypothetical protein